MEKNSEVIQTHPLVGWDISTVDSYDALMLRLHYQTPNQLNRDEAEVDRRCGLQQTSPVSLSLFWKQASQK